MGSDQFRVPRRNKSVFIYLPIGGCYNNNCSNSKLLSAFNINLLPLWEPVLDKYGGLVAIATKTYQ